MRFTLFSMVFFCAACGASLPDKPSAADISGTYRFLACDGVPCTEGSPNVYAEGAVVLANEPLAFRYASTRTMARLGLDADQRNPRINGCYSVKLLRKDVTVLGQYPAGGLRWERGKDGLIRFYLFYVPAEEAEYQVITSIDSAGSWEGAGKWKLRSPRMRRDYLFGARQGPPDSEPCREALDKRYLDEVR
jgi:hypothetical protein